MMAINEIVFLKIRARVPCWIDVNQQNTEYGNPNGAKLHR